ncbi:MAG: hypothetical protein HYZ93_03195 [Candidatus Omnitrophica bacterium]|nr:hypothetical protein [Candidatus Omnitrophota bacterium]
MKADSYKRILSLGVALGFALGGEGAQARESALPGPGPAGGGQVLLCPRETPTSTRRSYEQILGWAVKMALMSSPELREAYQTATVRFQVVPDLKGFFGRRWGVAPKRLANFEMDSFVDFSKKGQGILCEISLSEGVFRDPIRFAAAMNHELWHLKLYREGRQYATWAEKEIEAYRKSTEDLDRISRKMSFALGSRNGAVQELKRVVQEERRKLAWWQGQRLRPGAGS